MEKILESKVSLTARLKKLLKFDRGFAETEGRKIFRTDLKYATYSPLEALVRAQGLSQAEHARTAELTRAMVECVDGVDKILFALQCTIINLNGKVPGLTDQEVFDGAIAAREEMKAARANLASVVEKMEGER